VTHSNLVAPEDQIGSSGATSQLLVALEDQGGAEGRRRRRQSQAGADFSAGSGVDPDLLAHGHQVLGPDEVHRLGRDPHASM
jgi:hypothetical protein